MSVDASVSGSLNDLSSVLVVAVGACLGSHRRVRLPDQGPRICVPAVNSAGLARDRGQDALPVREPGLNAWPGGIHRVRVLFLYAAECFE